MVLVPDKQPLASRSPAAHPQPSLGTACPSCQLDVTADDPSQSLLESRGAGISLLQSAEIQGEGITAQSLKKMFSEV